MKIKKILELAIWTEVNYAADAASAKRRFLYILDKHLKDYIVGPSYRHKSWISFGIAQSMKIRDSL